MGFKDNVKSFATKFKLDSHHAIERFGVFFGVIVVTGALLFAGASTTAFVNINDRLDSKTLYTPNFTASKTQVGGTVTGVYVNTDHTRSMVLMQFADPAAVSSKAENYQAFVTGSSMSMVGENLKHNLEGQVVIFGSTGYMGIVFDSPAPFEQQILNVVVRANSELKYTPSEKRKVREDLKNDNTFAEYDQWQLFFNPGASGVIETAALDGKSFDAGVFYAQTVVKPEELKLRQEMDSQLGQMRADLAVIDEHSLNLAKDETIDGARLVPPEVPAQIAGDRVLGEQGSGKRFDPEDKDSLIDVSDSTLELSTDWVSPRGYDFDWRSGSVEKGWLDELVPADVSYGSFLSNKQSSKSDDDTLRNQDLVWEITGGKYPEGSVLDDYLKDPTMKPLIDVRNALTVAYQRYFTDKIAYQVDSYSKLIELEVELRNVRTSSSIGSTDAIISY